MFEDLKSISNSNQSISGGNGLVCVKMSFCSLAALAIGYLVYDWGENKHHELQRKNPKDYENDK